MLYLFVTVSEVSLQLSSVSFHHVYCYCDTFHKMPAADMSSDALRPRFLILLNGSLLE